MGASLVLLNCLVFLSPGLKVDVWGLGPWSFGNSKRMYSEGFSGPTPGESQVPAEKACWESLADFR